MAARIPVFSQLKLFLTSIFAVLLLCTSGFAQAHGINHAEEHDFAAVTPGQELGCLALNIYHEGRGESLKGQAAIASVTMNRVESKRFPDTVCEVVWQRKQFSWTHIAQRHHAITDMSSWQQALVIAQLFLDGARVAQVGDATHYHANTVRPYWVADNKLVGKVGNHYFYVL